MWYICKLLEYEIDNLMRNDWSIPDIEGYSGATIQKELQNRAEEARQLSEGSSNAYYKSAYDYLQSLKVKVYATQAMLVNEFNAV